MNQSPEDINSMGRLLSKASRLLDNRIMKEFSDYNIGGGQLYSMLAVYEEEGMCQKDICEIYDLNKAAVGRSLKKLENKGFIERKPDPEDERRKRVYIGEKGQSFRPECMKRMRKIEEDLRVVLTPEEIDIFKEAIEKICKTLEEGCEGGRVSGNYKDRKEHSEEVE